MPAWTASSPRLPRRLSCDGSSVPVWRSSRRGFGLGGEAGDQKRIATPAAAIVAGADYLVVGRPITGAADPKAAAAAIVAEIGNAAKEREKA